MIPTRVCVGRAGLGKIASLSNWIIDIAAPVRLTETYPSLFLATFSRIAQLRRAAASTRNLKTRATSRSLSALGRLARTSAPARDALVASRWWFTRSASVRSSSPAPSLHLPARPLSLSFRRALVR